MSYNSIIKTIFIILISFLCFSCNQKELQSHNEAFFIDLVKDQIKENDETIHSALIAKRPAYEFFPKMIRLQELREKAFELLLLSDFKSADTVLIKSYIDSLKTPITPEYGEKERVEVINKKIENIQYNHTEENKIKRITWMYNCLELEGKVLDLYARRAGIWCGWTSCDYFPKKDSIKLGEKYELVIFPRIARKKVEYLHNNFTFLLDEQEIKIDYEFEEVKKVGLLYFTPPKKGSYTIKGTYILDTASVELDKATLEENFRDNISQTFKVE